MRTRSIGRSFARPSRTICLTVALAVATLGCGRTASPDTAPAPAADGEVEAESGRFTALWPRDAIVPVEIQNHHTLDLTIYVVESGKSQRVAMATAAKSTYLRLPVRHLGPGNTLTLMAHAIGMARRLESDPMVVMPGQRVVWTIENGFHHASSAVWE
jgi:hypothetical protein